MKDSYTFFARYYDEIMAVVPYNEWIDYLMDILDLLEYQPETILDLGCGTGNIAIPLSRNGYNVVGIDGSKEMVDLADRKADYEELSVNFQVGDFRSFELEQKVDLIISLYDSLNYLLTEGDLYLAFKQAYRALKEDGYFIFDMNTISRLLSIEEGNKLVERDEFYCFWRDEIIDEGPYWKVYLTFFINQSDGSMYREDEVHTERAYPIHRVKELLEQAGFQIEAIYDAYSFESGKEESDRIYFIARKIKS